VLRPVDVEADALGRVGLYFLILARRVVERRRPTDDAGVNEAGFLASKELEPLEGFLLLLWALNRP
jgi:hypothetical protein